MAVATNQPDGTLLVPEPEAVTQAASFIDELQAQLKTSETALVQSDEKVTRLEGEKLTLTDRVAELEAQLAEAKESRPRRNQGT